MFDFSAHGSTTRDWVVILSGASLILVVSAAAVLLLAARRHRRAAAGTCLAGVAVLVIPALAVYNQLRPRGPGDHFEPVFELWFVWAAATAFMALLAALTLAPVALYLRADPPPRRK